MKTYIFYRRTIKNRNANEINPIFVLNFLDKHGERF